MLKSARLVILLAGAMLLAPALFGQISDGPRAIPLGVQSCDTQCQTTETDCDLACDQVAPCVDECKKTSEACAQKCRDAPPPPAKPEGSSKQPPPTGKKGAPAKAPGKAPPKVKPKSA